MTKLQLTKSQTNKKAKRLAGGLALTLAMTAVLTACSGSNEGGSKATGGASATAGGAEGPITISMMYDDNPSYPFNASWPVLEQFQKLANVKLDIQPTPDADYQNKLKIVLSSGSAPDLVSYVEHPVYMEFAQTGVFLPISDYLDKLPNLKQKLDQYGMAEELDNWTLKDGKLYGLPFMFESAMYNTAPVIRVDLLKKHNLKTPTTMDELYETLKKLKEADPKSYPMANLNGALGLINLSGAAWGIGPAYNGFVFNSEAGKFEYAYTSDNYKQFVTFLSRLMKEGSRSGNLHLQHGSVETEDGDRSERLHVYVDQRAGPDQRRRQEERRSRLRAGSSSSDRRAGRSQRPVRTAH